MKSRTKISTAAATTAVAVTLCTLSHHINQQVLSFRLHSNMLSSRGGSSFSRHSPIVLSSSSKSRSRTRSSNFGSGRSKWSMYDASFDQHKRSNGSDIRPSHEQDSDVVWSSLANTERWMQKTLGAADSPYSRKEVSYVCESSSTVEEIVAGLFRRLREVREIGVNHGDTEERVRLIQGSKYIPRTHRQTLVVVAPSNEELNHNFGVFDSLIQTINEARRNARDFFTISSTTDAAESNNNSSKGAQEKKEWVTSVNLGHMHPSFGLYTDEPLKDSSSMATDDSDPAPDEATKEYLARRMMAQRSPYPSMVIEVRSTPPFDMPNDKNREFKRNQRRHHPREEIEAGKKSVSMDDVKRLEALFGQGVSLSGMDDEIQEDVDDEDSFIADGSAEDDMWAKLAASQEIEEVSLLSPVDQAQQWVVDYDDQYCPEWSSFTSYDTTHVDAAYEFVFSTIAFQRNRAKAAAGAAANSTQQPYQGGYTAWAMSETEPTFDEPLLKLKRDYLLMPQFLSNAATSFEKFAAQVQNIINVIPGVSDCLTVSTFHPEHVDRHKRSPVPIMVLEWIPGDF